MALKFKSFHGQEMVCNCFCLLPTQACMLSLDYGGVDWVCVAALQVSEKLLADKLKAAEGSTVKFEAPKPPRQPKVRPLEGFGFVVGKNDSDLLL